MPTQTLANGHEDDQAPRDELDLRSQIVEQSDGNPLLQQSNLGLGNYTETYLWQQVRSYRKGLYAYIAFGNVLTKRAIYETKMELGRDGYVHFDENQKEVAQWDPLSEDDVRDDESSWTAERRRGKRIWDSLGEAPQPVTQKQVAAVIKKTGVEPGKWLPIYWQMVSGRHDVSRSLNAELIRDFLSDIKHLRDDAEGETTRSLLGGKT